jgi:iron complex transport system substrate-binding protein
VFGKSIVPPIVAVLLIVAAAACPAAAMRDAAGREIAAGDTDRIVSIGGAVTEILFGLGMEKNIVGIDTTSLYPPRAASEKASVGYMRQLSAEGVLGLRPTLIVMIDGAGPKETLSVLQSAGIPLVAVPDVFSGEGIASKIDVIAKAVGRDARARCMISRLRDDLGQLDKFRAAIGKKKRVLFVLSLVNGRALASGRNTAADGIIDMAGAVNAIDGYEGYKPLSDEAVIAAKPDVILTMQRGGPGTVSADDVFALPAFAASPAAANHAFVSMEGLYLLGFGPRTALAARDLAASLYPELKRETFPSEKLAEAAQCQD